MFSNLSSHLPEEGKLSGVIDVNDEGHRFGELDDPIEVAQIEDINKASLNECQDIYRYNKDLTENARNILRKKMLK